MEKAQAGENRAVEHVALHGKDLQASMLPASGGPPVGIAPSTSGRQSKKQGKRAAGGDGAPGGSRARKLARS